MICQLRDFRRALWISVPANVAAALWLLSHGVPPFHLPGSPPTPLLARLALALQSPGFMLLDRLGICCGPRAATVAGHVMHPAAAVVLLLVVVNTILFAFVLAVPIAVLRAAGEPEASSTESR